jgi:fructose-1,6-bisphosphatase/inositol monophosphatase family enzyme
LGLPPEAKRKFEEATATDDAFATAGVDADQAPTSRIDRELETVCIDYLARSGRIGCVLSEELGEVNLGGAGRLRTVLDPLDGTANAKMGFPYYALSLSLNGRRIAAAVPAPLKQSCVVSSRPLCDAEIDMYGRFMRDAKRVRISSSPALDVAHVACGTFAAYADYHVPHGLIHTHDVIAAKLILEEATTASAMRWTGRGRMRPASRASFIGGNGADEPRAQGRDRPSTGGGCRTAACRRPLPPGPRRRPGRCRAWPAAPRQRAPCLQQGTRS